MRANLNYLIFSFFLLCLFPFPNNSKNGIFPLIDTTPVAEPESDTLVVRKIVLIAGKKSHERGMHEYIKTVRLLKAMLDHSNVKGIQTEIHLDGWPKNPATLDNAALILTISDGQDGELFSPVPFMTPQRMAIMEKQMKRGCGFATLHFSTFTPDEYGPQILEWGGGYFDWQDETGKKNWYSAIKTAESEVKLASPAHPVSSGVKPFHIKEEFYYNIRFGAGDPRLTPIIEVPELGGRNLNGNVVAWAVERKDGGRGFGTTMGHYYANWQNAGFRKLMLNAIVWAAGAQVPKGGVESRFYTDRQVTQLLFGKSLKGLILTGNHHPAHIWQETTPFIKTAVEKDNRFFVDVSTNIEDLMQYDLQDYDVLILNYCNWEDPKGLSDQSKKAFTDYLNNGGGLIIVHFANGAFHYSLPGAAQSDWPEYRKISRRVWDHTGNSAHDKYGKFIVKITQTKHPVTQGIGNFEVTDELYYNQKGDQPIEPLLVATSKDTGKDEPLAWAYTYGKGHVFQIMLGHSKESLQAPQVQEILKRAAAWTVTGK